MPLFFPVTRHSEATRLPLSFWKVSITSNWKLWIFCRKPRTQAMKFSLPRISTPPVVMTKSSTMKFAAASGFCAFHTADQNSSTILTESMPLPLTASGHTRRSQLEEPAENAAGGFEDRAEDQ